MTQAEALSTKFLRLQRMAIVLEILYVQGNFADWGSVAAKIQPLVNEIKQLINSEIQNGKKESHSKETAPKDDTSKQSGNEAV